ncbi:MAG TPA: CopD family protein [Pseudohongiella sp.]|nr:CopD family protein [Pseudohongiella sp.]
MDVWELSGVFGKALVYIGMLAAIGGLLIIWLGRETAELVRLVVRRYMLPTALLGLLASCFVFVVLVGSVNQNGISGMFDPVIGGILRDAQPGTVLRWRLAGFVLTLLALVPLNLPVQLWQEPRVRQFSIAVLLAAAVCFAVGVGSQGHAAPEGLLAQFMASAHFIAIACWAGTFYPLYSLMLSRDIPAEAAARTAERFGQVGWGILGLMLVSGLTLIWQITAGPLSLMQNTHGKLLLVKLGLVALMMALGALHKFIFVPGLRTAIRQGDEEHIQDSRRLLARSIRSESLLALLVLILTATLTTVTGPGH